MIEIDLNEEKRIQLEILDYFHKVCIDNNIKYSLAFGTLIGAIRHKGYIPWDDDIDVMIYERDIIRLYNIINSDSSIYRLYYCKKDPNFPLSFCKLAKRNTLILEKSNAFSEPIGINIDIFPIYQIDYKRFKYKNIQIKLNQLIYQSKSVKANEFDSYPIKAIKRMANALTFFCNLNSNANKMIDKLTQCSGNDNYLLVDEFSCKVLNIDLLNKIKLSVFENNSYFITEKYDCFLKLYYNDYMKLPPEEERATHHSKKAYVKENGEINGKN